MTVNESDPIGQCGLVERSRNHEEVGFLCARGFRRGPALAESPRLADWKAPASFTPKTQKETMTVQGTDIVVQSPAKRLDFYYTVNGV